MCVHVGNDCLLVRFLVLIVDYFNANTAFDSLTSDFLRTWSRGGHIVRYHRTRSGDQCSEYVPVVGLLGIGDGGNRIQTGTT